MHQKKNARYSAVKEETSESSKSLERSRLRINPNVKAPRLEKAIRSFSYFSLPKRKADQRDEG